MACVYIFSRALVKAVSQLFFRLSYYGIENIPAEKKNIIVISNHSSYYDPIALAIGVAPKISFLAKSELFSGRFGWFIKLLGAVSIDRGRGDKEKLESFGEKQLSGWWLGIFPEGTRHKDGVLGKPKSGTALIAKFTGSDILPCFIEYDGPLRLGCSIKVNFGELIPYGSLGLEDDSPRALRKATNYVWDKIVTLKEESVK
jgi:1-acyl-sn-glycerol-3-phosphate acyltransferase